MMEMPEEGKKIVRINLFQTAMTLGSKLGLYTIIVYVVTMLTFSHQALSILALPLLIGIPFVAYYLINRERQKISPDFFPFPVAWMIAILTFLFSTVLSTMAVYAYMRFFDNGHIAASLKLMVDNFQVQAAAVSATMTDSTQIQAFSDQMKAISDTVAGIAALSASAFTKIIAQSSLMWGNIFALVIGIITTKRIKLINNQQ